MPHYLIVQDLGEEFDRWVEHEDDCPKEVRYVNTLSGEIVEQYICGVGYWETGYGFMDLEEDPRFTTPGRHEIFFYSYTPQSMFEDAEAYLEFVG